jgi:hypothetical protein
LSVASAKELPVVSCQQKTNLIAPLITDQLQLTTYNLTTDNWQLTTDN